MERNNQFEESDTSLAQWQASRVMYSRTIAAVCLAAFVLCMVFAYIFRDYNPSNIAGNTKRDVPVLVIGHLIIGKK